MIKNSGDISKFKVSFKLERLVLWFWFNRLVARWEEGEWWSAAFSGQAQAIYMYIDMKYHIK